MAKFRCPNCGVGLEADGEVAGQSFTCPRCGQAATIGADGVAHAVPGERPAAPAAPKPAPRPAAPKPPAPPVAPKPPPQPAASAVGRDLVKPVFELDLDRGMTISQYLSAHGLEGGQELAGDTNRMASVLLESEKGKKYAVGALLAEGGMGGILHAKDLNLRRQVAMKVMRQGAQAGGDDILRFIEEAQVTGQLEHPNIVPVHELGVDATGNVFFTMKLVKGVTLKDILKDLRAGKPAALRDYPLSRLLNVFLKICDALALAHARGVIHRDLKPENIMVGEYGEVLVMDWGIAKLVPKAARVLKARAPAVRRHAKPKKPAWVTEEIETLRQGDVGQRTLVGSIVGTPHFMAPEQAYGKVDELDARTDIYALGGILYNILTLHRPIEGDNVNEVLLKKVEGAIPDPTTHTSGGAAAGAQAVVLHHCPGQQVPPALAAVAMKALALEPDDRYRTVKELQAEIEAYQTGFATAAEHAGLWRQSALLVRRHKAAFSAMGLATVAIAVIFAGAFGRVKLSEQKALAEKRRAEKALADVEAAQAARQADRKSSAPALVETAKTLILAKNFDPALTALATAVDYDPQLPDARLLIMAVYYLKGQYGKALESCQAYAALRPGDAQGKRLVAMCQMAVTKGPNAAPTGELGELLSQKGMPTLGAEFVKVAGDKLNLYQAQVAKAWPGASVGMGADGKLDLGLGGRKDVVDLTPLSGIPLSSLDLGSTGVRELTPLKGMPLTALNLFQCGNVRDLAPLQGMPLTSLGLRYTGVSDLTPLKGMPLTSLALAITNVSDLTPLKGMPLTSLNMGHCGQVSDLTPLKGMPLTSLDLTNCAKVSDLTPLQGMPLTTLNLTGTGIRDLKPLQGMPLTSLNLSNTPVRELTPLQGMPLTALNLANTPVSDLKPLQGMPLTALDVNACGQVSDLTPLQGMPLTALNLANTPVRDLTPLKGMKTLAALYGCDPWPLVGSGLTEAARGKNAPRVEAAARQLLADWSDVPVMAEMVERAKEYLEVVVPLMKNPDDFPAAAKAFGGHHYYAWKRPWSWLAAKELCEAAGGHLVTITSQEEHALVMQLCQEAKLQPHCYLGLEERAGKLVWITGEPWSEQPFCPVTFRDGPYGALRLSPYDHRKPGDLLATGGGAMPCLVEWDR